MTALVGEDVAAGARAAQRAANHADWQRLSWLHEMCRARAGRLDRAEEPDAAVAATAFGWSMAMATAQLALAAGVIERLPDLGEALWAGWLEQRKAAVFVTVLADLDDAQATNVVATVLPDAPGLPVHQLTQRVTAAAEAVDPLWAERRHRAARAHARIRTYLGPAGTAFLSVCDADPEMAQDAYLYVQALARRIRFRLRAGGRRVRLGHIANHLLLRLSSGTLVGADDEAVIAAVVQELADDPYAVDGDPGSDDGPEPDDGPESDDRPEPDDGPGPRSGPPDEPESGPDAPESGPDGPEAGPDDGPTDGPGSGDGRPGRARPAPESDRVPLLPGVVLRLPLSTLLGLDDLPGELPGLGPVTGHRSADIARRRPGARCRILLHNPAGALEYLLDLGPPPAATTNRRRRQIVEITAETGFFDALDPEEYAEDRRELVRRACAALEAVRADPDSHPAVSTADRYRRFPGPALAAWVRARDQRCPFRACTRPAHDNDLDHTLAHTDGGMTEAANLSPPCRAHHTRKHRAWRLRQPRPGRFVVTDPTGTEHHTVSRVVDPLPETCPPVEEEPDRPPPEAFRPVADEPAEPWPPRRTRDGCITPEARDAAAHLVARARRLRGDPPTRYDDDPDF